MDEIIFDPIRRRSLLMAGGGAAALLMAGTPVLAAGDGLRGHLQALAGKLFYTTQKPGRWEGKAKGHAPVIEVDKDGGDILIRSTTNHSMSAAHHIVKHIMLDGNLDFIEEQVFDFDRDMPKSKFTLEGYKGRLFIVSMCNLHDNWINSVDVT